MDKTQPTETTKDKITTFIDRYGLWLVPLMLAITVALPLLLVLPAWWSHTSFVNTGQIGDTIGGTTAPLIGLLNAILVYLAFRTQIRANEELRAITDQAKMDADNKHAQLRRDSEFQHINALINELDRKTSTLKDWADYIRSEGMGKSIIEMNEIRYMLTEFSMVDEHITESGLSQSIISRKLRLLYQTKCELILRVLTEQEFTNTQIPTVTEPVRTLILHLNSLLGSYSQSATD